MDPLASTLALAALAFFCASSWGWGRITLALCCVEARGVAYPVALGLATLAALGGVLNLFAIAAPPALWALLAAGWIAASRGASSGSRRCATQAPRRLSPAAS